MCLLLNRCLLTRHRNGSGAADEAVVDPEHKHAEFTASSNHYVLGTDIGSSDVEQLVNYLTSSLVAPAEWV